MEFSLLALLGISLAAMFFGYFFGLFEGRGQGYKKRKKEETSDPSVKAALQATLPPPNPPAAAPAATAPAEGSLLRLSLDAREQPCLDLDGQRVDTSRMEPQQRKRLIDLMVMMRPWIDASPVQRPGTVAVPRPVSPQPVVQAAVSPPPVPEPGATPTTMVGQIDAILQANLVGTPLATRGVRLVESTKGGALVVVGLNRYEGVGEVPDPEVQAAIRTAIAEWERKYTPS